MTGASLASLALHGACKEEIDIVCWPRSLCADLRRDPHVDSMARLVPHDGGPSQNWVVQTDELKLRYLQRAPAAARLVYFEVDMLFVAHPARLLGMAPQDGAACHLTLTYRKDYKMSTGSVNSGLIAIHNASAASALLLRANALLRQVTASRPVIGGENQAVLDRVGLRDIPFGQSRTAGGITVCSVDVAAVTVLLSYHGLKMPSESALCKLQPPAAGRSSSHNSLIAVHFNGPALTKELLQRVWRCWHARAKNWSPRAQRCGSQRHAG